MAYGKIILAILVIGHNSFFIKCLIFNAYLLCFTLRVHVPSCYAHSLVFASELLLTGTIKNLNFHLSWSIKITKTKTE